VTTPHSTDLVPAAGTMDRFLSDRTAERIRQSVPENTQRAYARQLERFTAWCAEHGRTALPATGETLAEFVSHLCDLDLGPSSIDQAITAIRTQHRTNGYPQQPDTEGARRVLRVHRRERAEAGQRTHKAPPIVLDRLQLMIEATPADTLLGRRDRALLITGFAMMARRSELAALNIADVVEDEDGLTILVRASKTDQAGVGAEVHIPAGVHSDTDPVRVMRRYLAALAERGITEGRLFRSVDRHGNPGSGISADGINKAVRAAAERAGLDRAELFSAHGLRAGGATSAYRAGAPVSAITTQGRWSERSTTVLGYIRVEDQRRNNPMRGIGL
jgi:integrase